MLTESRKLIFSSIGHDQFGPKVEEGVNSHTVSSSVFHGAELSQCFAWGKGFGVINVLPGNRSQLARRFCLLKARNTERQGQNSEKQYRARKAHFDTSA